jgi:hypothetical protein
MPLASLAILAAALSYGVARIYERRSRAMGIAPVAAATDEVAALRLIPVLVAPIADTSWASSAPGDPRHSRAAAISTALVDILYFRILSGADSANTAMVTLHAPVTSIAPPPS